MPYTLLITNETDKKQYPRVLSSLYLSEKNYGLPEGVTFEAKDSEIKYENILASLMYPMIGYQLFVKFISSTKNRQLSFYHRNAHGSHIAIEPQKNTRGQARRL